MSFKERQHLGQKIQLLNTDQLMGLLPIIGDEGIRNNGEGSLEFDLKELSDIKCRTLEKYVNECLGYKPKLREDRKSFDQRIQPPQA